MDASDRRARDSNHGRRPDSPAAGASCTGIVMPMLLKGVPEGHRHRRARGRVPSRALVNIKLPFRMVGACRPELRTPSPHSAAGDSFGSSGPMEVFGRYSSILAPDGTAEGLDRYLTLARQAVRCATTPTLDQLPLETFDARTRFAVSWATAPRPPASRTSATTS